MALTQTGTDGIKNDAITLAKQAAGTDGQIITYDASGNPVAVGPGTDGQVLTSTGAGSPPAFEDIPAKAALTGSTNNTITTVTGANAIQGEANLTFDGSILHAQDSTGTTPGTAQLVIRKGACSGAANAAFTRANSYIHLGGSEWGTNSDGLYALSFGYAQGSGSTYTPAYLGFKETSASGNTKGDLVFATRDATSDSIPTERVRIDSSGYVTTPNQPRFCAEKNGSGSTTTTANATQVFQSEAFDIGGHYNNSTGVFTAPVAGYYYFYCQMLGGNNDNRVMFYFNKNDSSNLMEVSGTSDNYNSVKGSLLVSLAANDTMRIKNQSTTVDLYQDSGYQNQFMGWLVA